jgi:hypothetical protein
MNAPRFSFMALPIWFTISTPRLMRRILMMLMMMMSFPTLCHGTASDPALPQSKALVLTWRQDATTSRELRMFSVIENFMGFLVRNILMVRSITWWIGFQCWCEAVYCTRLRHSLLSANLKQVAKPRGRRGSAPDRTDLEPQMGHKGNVKAGPGSCYEVTWHIPDANCGGSKGRPRDFCCPVSF